MRYHLLERDFQVGRRVQDNKVRLAVGVHHLHPRIRLGAEGGAQCFVLPDQAAYRTEQRFFVKLSVDQDGDWSAGTWAQAVRLLGEPQPLLRWGQRDATDRRVICKVSYRGHDSAAPAREWCTV